METDTPQQTQINVILNLFYNISSALEQIHVLRTIVRTELVLPLGPSYRNQTTAGEVLAHAGRTI